MSAQPSTLPLLSFYARQGLWGHLEREANKYVSNNSDPAFLWWRAIAVGFASQTFGTNRHSQAIQELSTLGSKRDWQLPVLVALSHFRNIASNLDAPELNLLQDQALREREIASDESIVFAARFCWYAAIHASGRDCRAHYSLCASRLLEPLVEDAASTFTKTRGHARVILAWVKMLAQTAEEARVDETTVYGLLWNATRRQPCDHLENCMARAHFFERTGRFELAMEQVDHVVAVQLWIPALLEKSKLLILSGNWDQAFEVLKIILQQHSLNLMALRFVALHQIIRGADEASVLKHLTALVQAFKHYEPDNGALHLQTTRALSRACGRRPVILEVVISLTKRALMMFPQQAGTLAELAHQQAIMGDYRAAIATCHEAVIEDEANPEALLEMVYCLVQCGELDDAEQQLEFTAAIADSTETSPRVPFLTGLIKLRRFKDTDGHLELLKRSQELLQQSEKLHLHRFARVQLADVFDEYTLRDPDFVLQLATEYLHHIQPLVNIGEQGIHQDSNAVKRGVVATEYLHHIQPLVNVGEQGTQQDNAIKRGIDLLERLTDQVPGLTGAHLLLAKACFQFKQFTLAERRVQIVIGIDGRCVDAHILLARILLARRKDTKALTALEEALAYDFEAKKKPAFVLTKAKFLSNRGDYDEAYKQLRALSLIVTREGRDLDLLWLSGMSLDETASVFIELGKIHTALKQYMEAGAILAEAENLFRNTAQEIRIIVARSELSIQRGDFQGGMSLLGGVPQSSASYDSAQIIRAKFYLEERQDKHSYIQCFREMTLMKPTARTHECLGDALMRIQAPGAAIDAFEQSQLKSGFTPLLAGKIGKALIATHDYAQATAYYTQALKAHSADPVTRHNLAELHMKLGNYESALQVLYALGPKCMVSTDAHLSLGVRSLLLLVEVSAKADLNGCASALLSPPAFSREEWSVTLLLRARDVQQGLMDQLETKSEPCNILDEHKNVMAQIHIQLARLTKDEGLRFWHLKEALRIDQAIQYFNFARHDGVWGPSSLSNMSELCIDHESENYSELSTGICMNSQARVLLVGQSKNEVETAIHTFIDILERDEAKRLIEAIDVCVQILAQYPDYPSIRNEILDKAIRTMRA
ncbi:hypothetical protein CTAYLR_010601 [Chrysophaeum taylorii]|uniref:Tetratricopeptide repeat protein n=1 Tax=Chrysophaeum taylorii TaxID=2483200 RepID=A0AAD7UEL8_9STRA|nr:hypothetical protein CTAYLR_010601 [Chrysophaeum taylorii]